MARIDWIFACDYAFFDRENRLCVVGIVRRLPAPELPLAIHQLMLVARLADIHPTEEVELGVAVITPRGVVTVPRTPDSILIEVETEYVLVTLRDLPIREEGVYRFQIALRGQPAAAVDIP